MAIGVTDILYYSIRPTQLRAIVQWKTWHQPVHERDEKTESPELQKCFEYLRKTSRSFSAVILELHPELLVPVTVFYLVLRGLDTVEDDMTMPLDVKDPLLRNFSTHISEPGWHFEGSGPDEKDRDLLEDFGVVVGQFNQLKPAYQTIIKDIAHKMGNGMADYCNNAEYNANGVNTIAEYDLYCHYVAGLVGEGLTRLFVEAKLANPLLLERGHLYESMGCFLQKINIIRDIREDFEDKRRFWPKEIWSKHVDRFEDLFKPENKQQAMACSTEMVLDALKHVDDCLFYLAGLKEQSIFNFAAIPQSMALATLELCFQNPALFQRNVKLPRGETCRIMLDSTQNVKKICDVFRKYTRKILRKNKPKDPDFVKISIACGKIEKFIDGLFPPKDPHAAQSATDSESEIARKALEDAEAEEAKWDTIYLLAIVMSFLFIMSTLMIGIAWYLGARWNLGRTPLSPYVGESMSQGRAVASSVSHEEL